MDAEVLIVGGGLAGLSCADHLNKHNISFLLFEKDARAGGRIKSDVVDGFILDRGFQVLLDSYPAARSALNLGELNLKPFDPGSYIFRSGRMHRFYDPLRSSKDIISAALSPLMSFRDKILVSKLIYDAPRILKRLKGLGEDQSTLDFLLTFGFSPRAIKNFFKPFFGGVFLENNLKTSAQFLLFIFEMFASGNACLPTHGMEEIPKQMANRLPPNSIYLGSTVERISDKGEVHLKDGRKFFGAQVVVATENYSADYLLSRSDQNNIDQQRDWNGTHCFYFAAIRPPSDKKALFLNAEESSIVQHLCIPTNISPSYSTTGRSLVSVSCQRVLQNTESTVESILSELKNWFPQGAVEQWEFIKSYSIPYALPAQLPRSAASQRENTNEAEKILLAGDYTQSSSINGALESGVHAAMEVMRRIRLKG